MFSGSIVALVTPFRNDQIDVERLRALVEFHIERGTQGIVVAGCTGEAGTLSDEEKKQVISHVVEQVNERIPVIAGTGSQSTRHTIELTRMATMLGADAALVMTPAAIKPTQEGLYQHYKHIAQAVPLPLILYNVPSRTACDILPETIGRLSVFANIIGVKEATGDLNRIHDIKNHCVGEFDVLTGEDGSSREFMRQGGNGVISVTANVVPDMMFKLCQASLQHKEDEDIKADNIQTKLMPLHRALFIESNPIPTKWVLAKMGLISDEIRLPLTLLSLEHQAALMAALKGIGEKR